MPSSIESANQLQEWLINKGIENLPDEIRAYYCFLIEVGFLTEELFPLIEEARSKKTITVNLIPYNAVEKIHSIIRRLYNVNLLNIPAIVNNITNLIKHKDLYFLDKAIELLIDDNLHLPHQQQALQTLFASNQAEEFAMALLE